MNEDWKPVDTIPTKPGTRVIALVEVELEMEEHIPSLLMGGWKRKNRDRIVGWRSIPVVEGADA